MNGNILYQRQPGIFDLESDVCIDELCTQVVKVKTELPWWIIAILLGSAYLIVKEVTS